ncbi:MAG: hypothetical protein DRJ96_07140 [Thermoprotei archaeon]|nr:MAG: hypothetical protein DRJ96_07140 [Thermoprotei archaeon]
MKLRIVASALLAALVLAALAPVATAVEEYTPYEARFAKTVSLIVNVTHSFTMLYNPSPKSSVTFTYRPPHDVVLYDVRVINTSDLSQVSVTVYIDGEAVTLPAKLDGGVTHEIKLDWGAPADTSLYPLDVDLNFTYAWNTTAEYVFEIGKDGGYRARLALSLEYEPDLGLETGWTDALVTDATIDVGMAIGSVSVSGPNVDVYRAEDSKVTVMVSGKDVDVDISAVVTPGSLTYGTEYALKEILVGVELGAKISSTYVMLLRGGKFALIDKVSEPHEWKAVVAYNKTWTREYPVGSIEFPDVGRAKLFLLLVKRVEGTQVYGHTPKYYAMMVDVDTVDVGEVTIKYEVVDDSGQPVTEITPRVNGFEEGEVVRPGVHDLVVKANGVVLGRFSDKETVDHYDGSTIYSGLGAQSDIDVDVGKRAGEVTVKYTLYTEEPANSYVSRVYSFAAVTADVETPTVVVITASKPVIAKIERGVASVEGETVGEIEFTEANGWLLFDVTTSDSYHVRLWTRLTVKVFKDGQPVEGAKVEILDANYNVVATRYTDSEGKAVFMLEPEARYTVQVTSGREVTSKTITLMRDSELAFTVTEAPPRVIVSLNTVLLLVVIAIIIVAAAIIYMVWRLRGGVVIE